MPMADSGIRKNTQADPSSEKRQAYQAASALLSKQDDTVLIYAALELRRCMEAIVYEKLLVYGVLLPENSVYKWAPSQAFDALIEIEPNAQETFAVAVGLQDRPDHLPKEPLRVIGVDERPKSKWVKKTWNKMGAYLHAEWPFGAASKQKIPTRDFLAKTLAELAPFVNNSFTFMMSDNIDFRCGSCGTNVRVMSKTVEERRCATCLTCGVRYRAEKDKGGFTFFPDEPLLACECGVENPVPLQRIKVGYRFPCSGCERVFEAVGEDWRFSIVDGKVDVAPEDGK